ncbi:hypothetical protein N007_12040 [Alicyclobacillus acidoterrestris ATCC 49025]|nr:hypothetical protein N007_12040 [Alicyclobacillus acidoterrestris ATCC 49025]
MHIPFWIQIVAALDGIATCIVLPHWILSYKSFFKKPTAQVFPGMPEQFTYEMTHDPSTNRITWKVVEG